MVAASPVRGALRWPVDLLAAATCRSAAERPREGGREAKPPIGASRLRQRGAERM
ncbi:unnamed protein product [Miscanthus lutarioriparius]|uniref:Uncharacterized protein n=1 Tax=Miscanthus lutarioriparius TaxID=422564 RepID=A0A811RK84_9POAL|nr:unnamed protein product [Miscanthus lutarioriparius]